MYSMNYIGKFISNFRDFYNEINAATLTGAIDVIVVQQPDGSYTCSPFHVRFGKLGVLRSREKVVDIEINSEPRDIHMKLGEAGEAFFVEEVPGQDGFLSDSDIPPHLACSPIPNDVDYITNSRRFNILSDLPDEQHEKILRDSVMSIEREKWEQMSALPPDQREKFLIEHFSELPIDQREKWLQIASLTSQERDKIFNEYYGTISTEQKQRIISEQYSALKTEDKEKLFKENFPELPADQRQRLEKALMTDWKQKDVNPTTKKAAEVNDVEEIEGDEDDERFNDDEEIFDMEGINEDEQKTISPTSPKSFVAVTSTDRIRKISVVKNDFRPINSEEMSLKVHAPLSTSSSSSSTHKTSKDESNDENKNGKRKRKRKSVMKRKSTTRKNSSMTNELGIQCSEEFSKEETNNLDPDSKVNADGIKAPENVPMAKISISHPSMDFHFFSDTEVTSNDKESRSNSPVQSDTEFEVHKITKDNVHDEDSEQGQSWKWGELPSRPQHDNLVDNHDKNAADTSIQNNDTDARRSMLGGMFSFMKKTSRVRHNPESEGIYLSDLNADELDPEVAALYFPTSYRGPGVNITKEKTGDEEDAESGNGPSLPQSPNSVIGAIGGPKSLDSDFDESTKNFESLDLSLSLCGLDHCTDENFQSHLLRFEDCCSEPKIFSNVNLVVKINGKYYDWNTACAIVMTYAAFQRNLSKSAIEMLECGVKKNNISSNTVKGDTIDTNGATEASGGGYSSWFSWRRSSQPTKKSPDSSFIKTDDPVLTPVDAQHSVEISPNSAEISSNSAEISSNSAEISSNTAEISSNSAEISPTTTDSKMTIIVNDEPQSKNVSELTNSAESLNTSQSLASFSDAVDTNEQSTQVIKDEPGYSACNEDSEEEDPSGIDIPKPNTSNLSTSSIASKRSYHEGNYRKTLRLSSEQIASLNLKEGVNEVVFSVTTAYQGTTRCKCFIYKWRWDDKIVVSDIDGTITKSDVLGHILPIVGKDWAQSGVAQLFTKIENNGYKLLYLSARAIGQSRVTREYLKSIKQGNLSLPDGPLLLNPTSLISAFHREVIEKKPEEFKISCLSDIKALFPDGSEPFYAGYGNRINDVWAYRAVGVPTTRIFTINHRGELKHELTQTFQSSYSNMSYIVDHLFPAFREDGADEFSNFCYWRDPIQHKLLDTETITEQN